MDNTKIVYEYLSNFDTVGEIPSIFDGLISINNEEMGVFELEFVDGGITVEVSPDTEWEWDVLCQRIRVLYAIIAVNEAKYTRDIQVKNLKAFREIVNDVKVSYHEEPQFSTHTEGMQAVLEYALKKENEHLDEEEASLRDTVARLEEHFKKE